MNRPNPQAETSDAIMTTSEQELRERLAGPAGEWVEEAAAAAGGHPDFDELVAYRGGELPDDDRRRLQDHLVTCRDCLELMLELDAFLRPETEPEERTAAAGAADFATAAGWRALRSRLPSGEAGPAEGARSGPRPRRWVAALAASLAVAVIVLALFALQLHRDVTALDRQLAELSRPQPGAAIVDLYPVSAARGEGEAAPVAELPAATGYATLVVNLPEGAGEASYEVEIVDPEGRILWSGSGFEASRFGTLRLGLPDGFLAPGEHALRLYAGDGEERHWIETYPLRVPEP